MPIAFVRLAWSGLIANTLNVTNIDQFVAYFESMLNRRFSLSDWNVHNIDGPRTNSHLEGWQSKVKKLAGRPHLNITKWSNFSRWNNLTLRLP